MPISTITEAARARSFSAGAGNSSSTKGIGQIVRSSGQADPRTSAVASSSLRLTAFPTARRRPAENGLLYLNVGHTGLDDPSLGPWIARGGRSRRVPDPRPDPDPSSGILPSGRASEARAPDENALCKRCGAHREFQRDPAEIAGIRGRSEPADAASYGCAWIAGPPIPEGVTPQALRPAALRRRRHDRGAQEPRAAAHDLEADGSDRRDAAIAGHRRTTRLGGGEREPQCSTTQPSCG